VCLGLFEAPFFMHNITMRKWKPSLKLVNRIIQDYKGCIYHVSRELQCEIDDLKKYEALWPNNELKDYFERKDKFIKCVEAAKAEENALKKERLKKDVREQRRLKYAKIKEVIEKYEGDRKKAAAELGMTNEAIKKAVQKVFYTYDDFQYFKPRKKGKETRSIFPTNEERLYYKDNPHIKYIKQGLCSEKRNEEI